jgi:protein-arginine kinase
MPLLHCQIALLHLRYGIALGLFKTIDIKTINQAILISQDSHLQKKHGYSLEETEKNALRADLMRQFFLK